MNSVHKFDYTQNQWTWVGLHLRRKLRRVNQLHIIKLQIHGDLDVASKEITGNSPPEKLTPGGLVKFGWTSNNGDLWIFGGYESEVGFTNAYLWKYVTSLNSWVFYGGSYFEKNYPGSYAVAPFWPSARSGSCMAADPKGHIWLFGGLSPAPATTAGYSKGLLNDLWQFNTTSSTWKLISAPNTARVVNDPGLRSSKGFYSTDRPQGLTDGSMVIDSKGNLFFYGGSDESTNNLASDLWTFDTNAPQKGWAWLETYPLLPSDSNFGGRMAFSMHVENSKSRILFFAGQTYWSVSFGKPADLRSYSYDRNNPTALGNWSMVGGDVSSSDNVFSVDSLRVSNAGNRASSRVSSRLALTPSGLIHLFSGNGVDDFWCFGSCACDIGTYAMNMHTGNCLKCPLGSNSTFESRQLNCTTCVSGYYGSGHANCPACPVGTFVRYII